MPYTANFICQPDLCLPKGKCPMRCKLKDKLLGRRPAIPLALRLPGLYLASKSETPPLAPRL